MILILEEENKMLNRMKKVLAVTLAATTILGTSLTAFAASDAGSAAGSAAATSSTGGSGSSSSTGSTSETQAPKEGVSAVAGAKSTTAGINYATAVSGSAILTPAADIAAAFQLAANEKPFVKFYNFDAKKSNLAKAVVDAVASYFGYKVGPVVNVEIGKMTGKAYSLLPETGAIALAFGIPGNFAKQGTQFAIIKVAVSGVQILPDLDTNPNTITVATTGGQAVYAIVAVK